MRRAVGPDRDAAGGVGAQHRHRVEVGQHVRVGMAVVVVGADADDGDARPDGVEEALGVRVAAVVGDLEHLCAQLVGAGEQPPLRLLLRVAGQQQPPPAPVHAQHQRAIVDVVGQRQVGGRAEHRHGRRAEAEARPRGDLVDRDAALACDGEGRDGGGRHVAA